MPITAGLGFIVFAFLPTFWYQPTANVYVFILLFIFLINSLVLDIKFRYTTIKSLKLMY